MKPLCRGIAEVEIDAQAVEGEAEHTGIVERKPFGG